MKRANNGINKTEKNHQGRSNEQQLNSNRAAKTKKRITTDGITNTMNPQHRQQQQRQDAHNMALAAAPHLLEALRLLAPPYKQLRTCLQIIQER